MSREESPRKERAHIHLWLSRDHPPPPPPLYKGLIPPLPCIATELGEEISLLGRETEEGVDQEGFLQTQGLGCGY